MTAGASPPPPAGEPGSGSAAAPPVRGTCHLYFAFDIGFSIQLDEVERMIELRKVRATLPRRRRAPPHFQYQPPPLRVTQPAGVVAVAGFHTLEQVDVVLYDFGAASLAYQIPLAGTLADLIRLSEALYEHAGLAAAARDQVAQLLGRIRPAVHRPAVSDAVEDYAVYHLAALAGSPAPSEFVMQHGPDVAQLLRAEQAALSAQEIEDALLVQVSFSEGDVAVVDWNAALVLDPDPGDVLSVLEYANVQLLEMRYLDHELDEALEASYVVLTRPAWRRRVLLGRFAADLRQVALLQADSAIMFEAATHSLKLLGDQYLARLYRAVSGRFRLGAWDASIRQKLAALDSIYTKLADRQQSSRLEVLEWIIIVLIALSIVVSLLPGLAGH
ncbi:MAG: hypothetical protein JXQ29_06700 [Planctomycetes bacterium]|nr:hypothetical protein [Planctomycetota bacterium]